MDWEQKIYIFLKKEIKRHTEMVCGIEKGSNVKKKVLMNRLINRESKKHQELWSLNVHNPFQSPITALTMQAKTNCISGWIKEQFQKTLKGILSNISSVLAHVNFRI